MKNDPFYESFYEKTSLIMTKDEKRIYKILPDTDSRREFIEEFWQIRDPYPWTDENENKIEFERRVRFANEWFGNWKTFQGRSMGEGKEKDRGWRSDRGRVYIILGPPDAVNSGPDWGINQEFMGNRALYEVWIYARYDLRVYFYRQMPLTYRSGGTEEQRAPYLRIWDMVLSPNTPLLYAMEDAKLNMIPGEFKGDFSKSLRFESEYEGGLIILNIPIDRVKFEDEQDIYEAEFHIKINVYKDHRKTDVIATTKSFRFTEEEVLDLEKITISIPYSAAKNENWLFDIIMTDCKSPYLAKFRDVIKH